MLLPPHYSIAEENRNHANKVAGNTSCIHRAESGTSSIQLSKVTQVPEHLQLFLQGCYLLSPVKEISRSLHFTRNCKRRTQNQCKNQTTLNTTEESSLFFLLCALDHGIKAKKREACAEGTLHHTSVL